MESRKLQGENCYPKWKRKVATKGGDLEGCFEVVDADAHVAQQHTYPFWLKCLQLQETDKDELLNREWLTDKHISRVGKLLQQQLPEQNCLQDSIQWWRKHTKSSIGQAKVRAFNTMKFKILLGGKPTPLMWSKNTGQVTGKGNQYTISENKEPQNSRYLTIIRRAWQRHECKYIINTIACIVNIYTNNKQGYT